MGRLTRDCEIRYVDGGGKAVVKFAIAVNGFKKDDVTFVDCVAWDKRGETINKYFSKGQRILVRGRLSIRSYETKDGEKRKSTEIIVEDFSFVEKAENGGGAARGAGITQTSEFEGDTGFDDDIPF